MVNNELSDICNKIAQMPVCPVCGYSKPVEPCSVCAENAFKQAQEAKQERERDIKRLGGLKAYESFTLANYTDKSVISMCDGFPDTSLFIFGQSGVGKTHLATAIIRGYREAWSFKPQQIYRKCRGLKGGDEEQEQINKFIKIPYLLIDDLGVDKKTDFSFSILYEILDGRDMSYKKGLIITSNMSLSALSERLGDDRIVSRIAGMCRIVEIKGKDHRMNNYH